MIKHLTTCMEVFPLFSTEIAELITAPASNMVAAVCFLDHALTIGTLPKFEVVLKKLQFSLIAGACMLRVEALTTVDCPTFIAYWRSSSWQVHNAIITLFVRAHSQLRTLHDHIEHLHLFIFSSKLGTEAEKERTVNVNALRTLTRRT